MLSRISLESSVATLKVKEDDPFGFCVVQGYAYAEGVDKPFGGWIVVDKSSEKVTVCDSDIQEQEKKEALESATVNVQTKEKK